MTNLYENVKPRATFPVASAAQEARRARGRLAVWQHTRGGRTSARLKIAMRLANILATACAALLVFVVGGGAWFMAFSALVFVLTESLPVGYCVGAVTGVLFGGLVATPLAQRLRRLLRSS